MDAILKLSVRAHLQFQTHNLNYLAGYLNFRYKNVLKFM